MDDKALLDAFRLIEDNKDKSDFEAIGDDDILTEAEKKLEVKFPPSYRSFLLNYGCGGIGASEFYGIIKDNLDGFGVPNVVWLTLDERQKWNYPPHLIIIADTGDGYWYALDSSKPNAEGEYPVVIYYDDAVDEKDRYEKVNEDFGEFLLEQVTQALEDEEDKGE